MTIASYKCCPEGVEVDVDGLATGKIGSVICLRCWRWFIGPKSNVGKGMGIMARMPGDVFIDEDGSLHAIPKRTRDFLAEYQC
jgi:hypothetical protein